MVLPVVLAYLGLDVCSRRSPVSHVCHNEEYFEAFSTVMGFAADTPPSFQRVYRYWFERKLSHEVWYSRHKCWRYMLAFWRREHTKLLGALKSFENTAKRNSHQECLSLGRVFGHIRVCVQTTLQPRGRSLALLSPCRW